MTKPIRNFCIVAHIDHGKSTLADRLIERTGALTAREMKTAQVLDTLEIEQERGITVKAQTATLSYRARDGKTWQLNLIDTPGHVDFSYEVARAMQACEGALLLVDATQGVEAQTLANAYLAIEQGLEIVPVINKIDLPNADVAEAKRQIAEVVGLDPDEAVCVSAKSGEGVDELLEAIVARIPPPDEDDEGPLRALVFDSWFDPYVGAIALVRVVSGVVRKGERVRLMSTGAEHEVQELRRLLPRRERLEALASGDVGYLVAGIKRLSELQVGDTITHAARPAREPLPGFRRAKPMVFAGIYPVDPAAYDELRDALEKLHLNDPAFTFEPESSTALGLGFRCGFLGMLHMEIVQERLEREFEQDVITTAPSVVYRVHLTDGEVREVANPSEFPEPQRIASVEEPVVEAGIFTPERFVGAILKLCEERRGVQKELRHAGAGRMFIRYELPLAEIVVDFFDRLKSVSRGYASLDYELAGWRAADVVKLDIRVHGEVVDALSLIVHREMAERRGRAVVKRLKELIPRQQFDVALQAAIGARVIARETVKALRKNVTAKCYGGDVTRKRKLLEKQKKGKKRLKQIGRVAVPQEAFHAVLRVKDEG